MAIPHKNMKKPEQAIVIISDYDSMKAAALLTAYANQLGPMVIF